MNGNKLKYQRDHASPAEHKMFRIMQLIEKYLRVHTNAYIDSLDPINRKWRKELRRIDQVYMEKTHNLCLKYLALCQS